VITSIVAVAVVWRFLLQQDFGLINTVLVAARDALEKVPDDLNNTALLLGRLRLRDALAAVRTHYQ